MFNLSKWIFVFVSILMFMYKSPFAPPFLPEPPSPLRRSFAPSFIPLGIVTVIFFLLEIYPEPRHVEHFPPLTNLCPKHFGQVWVVNTWIILLLPVITSSGVITTSVVMLSPFRGLEFSLSLFCFFNFSSQYLIVFIKELFFLCSFLLFLWA